MRRLGFASLAALIAVVGGCTARNSEGLAGEGGGGDRQPTALAAPTAGVLEREAGSTSLSPFERVPRSNDEFDHDEYLEILQAAAGIEDPPQVDLVRVIAPEDQPSVWKECMTTAGFAVSVTSDGGLVAPSNLPADQVSEYERADYVCHAQYPVVATMFRPYGEHQVKATYEYAVGVLVPCLEEHDFEIEQPPTWEAYRSSWVPDQTGGLIASASTWDPYASIDPATSGVDWESLLGECPQSPPTSALFPDE